MDFKLDRTVFQARNAADNISYKKQYAGTTWQERFQISAYLRSQAYRYSLDNPPRMDKTAFEARSRK